MKYSPKTQAALQAQGLESISIHELFNPEGEAYYRVDCMRTDGHSFLATFPTLTLARKQINALLGADLTSQLKKETV